MKNITKFLSIFGLLTFSISLFAEANPLQVQHETALNESIIQYKNAKTDFEKGYALELKAGALNTLKRSDEALEVINEAIKIDAKSASIAITKAKVLFALNKTDEAIAAFEPAVISLQHAASKVSEPIMKRMILAGLAEGFLTKTLIYMQQEKWNEALDALKNTDFVQQGVFAGASPFAYRAMLYQYILMRSKYDKEVVPELAKAVKDYEDFPKTYYGYIIKLLKGQDVKSDFMKQINKLSPTEKQDALAEWLFYDGAYKKYVQGDDAYALNSLEQLNKLAPYGNIEWINATRQFTGKQ